jgi:hypothetical protein
MGRKRAPVSIRRAVHLVPEGYERVDDQNGYTVIVKKGTQISAPEELPDISF